MKRERNESSEGDLTLIKSWGQTGNSTYDFHASTKGIERNLIGILPVIKNEEGIAIK